MSGKKRPIYTGPDSVIAEKEGWYVRRVADPGVDTVAEAAALAKALLIDRRNGYTYDHGGRVLRFTKRLFTKRLNFIAFLARIHGATKRELATIKKLIAYVKRHGRLPNWAEALARKLIVFRRRRSNSRRKAKRRRRKR